MTQNIAVLGAGSWGATLATLLSENGHKVSLWEFNPEQAKHLSSWRTLSFFPQLTVPKDVAVTSDLAAACDDKGIIVFVVPSHTLREVAKAVSALRADLSGATIVSATKGIETDSLKRMSEIIAAEIPEVGNSIVALSGPTHAEEVSLKIPTTVTAASNNSDSALLCQETFMTPYFRVYTNSDIIGVEAGGSLKNVLAIAAGICDGMGLGDNSKAALVTRGLREMVRLGIRMGGQQETFSGLTGLGDLIVTCFSRHSRNRNIGEKLGKGRSLTEAEKETVMVAEGVKTTMSAHELGRLYDVELPIMEQVYRVIYENKPPRESVQELMERGAKPEMELYK